jgi:hypothetical protein
MPAVFSSGNPGEGRGGGQILASGEAVQEEIPSTTSAPTLTLPVALIENLGQMWIRIFHRSR